MFAVQPSPGIPQCRDRFGRGREGIFSGAIKNGGRLFKQLSNSGGHTLTRTPRAKQYLSAGWIGMDWHDPENPKNYAPSHR